MSKVLYLKNEFKSTDAMDKLISVCIDVTPCMVGSNKIFL